MMSDAPIYLEKDQNIGWLTLNRPARKNALNKEMWQAIPDLVRDAVKDPAIKLLILRSAVENIFCAGADISEFDLFMTDMTARDENRQALRAACAALEDCDIPTLAMIQGACVGGGCILALCCDLRFGDTSSRYGITPAKLGLVYGLSDTRRLLDQVGPAATRDILFSARILSATKALQIGLVNEIYAPAMLEQEVRDYAALLLANSPHSLKEIKRVIKRVQNGMRDDDELSEEIFTKAFDGPDHQEGVEAFLNKRTPVY
ncbi:enoyl-CoA hydratase-related protein [Paremcibacter congregatus]|uniref:enoyl-CoA hydratase-related protein n=1 Tax=Paremcibacter congregatus TaxID=2043170 RepID=UPI0030EEE914